MKQKNNIFLKNSICLHYILDSETDFYMYTYTYTHLLGKMLEIIPFKAEN